MPQPSADKVLQFTKQLMLRPDMTGGERGVTDADGCRLRAARLRLGHHAHLAHLRPFFERPACRVRSRAGSPQVLAPQLLACHMVVKRMHVLACGMDPVWCMAMA